MKSLLLAEYATARRDEYMLQYVLAHPNMLSTTGYKVLQGQEGAGLIPCYRVVFNGKDKLDYDVESYTDLKALLPSLQPNAFLNYINDVLRIMLSMRSMYFLYLPYLETTLDKVFIDTQNNTVHMVYLPLTDNYLDYMNKDYEAVLKAELLAVMGQNPHLQCPEGQALYAMLPDPAVSIEQLQGALSGLSPLPQPSGVQVVTGIMASGETGSITQSGQISGSLESELENAPPEVETQVPETNAKRRKPAKKSLLSAFKKTPLPAEPAVEIESSGTEVLGEVFVPDIVLLCKNPKDEILVKKREFLIGKQIDKVDYAISYSTAISRVHCKISHNEGRNYVTDLGSSNGTYINGRKLEPHKPSPANPSDNVKLGNITFTIRQV